MMHSSSSRRSEDQRSVASSSFSSSSILHHQRSQSWDASTMTASQEELDLEKRGLMLENSERENHPADPSHTLLTPELIRDIIIGLSDGLTVPFALTAGLSGLDNAKIVVIGGLAELVSGAISMGVGGMLSAQAELDHYRHRQRQTSARVQQEKRPERLFGEVETIFDSLGVSAETARRVAQELYCVEQQNEGRGASSSSTKTCQTTGLTPLLLRMGEGLEPVEEHRVWQSALTIGLSYFFGGFIPLLPYLFFSQVSTALYASITITALTLLVFGVVKQKCTGLGDYLSLTKSALSTLAVGAIAAGSSWAIVRAMES